MAKLKVFSNEEEKQIISAIKSAEHNTSGEIRFYVESKCEGDSLERGVEVFHHMRLHEKHHRNGVLFYLATDHRKFAVVGDEGIHAKVADNFWDDVKAKMLGYFAQGKLAEGICEGIKMAGEKLKEFFPYDANNKDGYADTINYGK